MGPGCDEDLARRLPLPLAQLYRRAHNAKAALERHQAAYYLWEAALKLLASAAVVEYAGLPVRDEALDSRLRTLVRPALGHWWELARRLVPFLADAGDEGFRAMRDLLLGRTRDDLPRAAGLDALLLELLEGSSGPRSAVRLAELFERLLRYRNRELAHGAAGQRSAEFYARMGGGILAGVSEVLQRLDVLAGRRLIHVDDVRRQASGSWLVERCELAGESGRRLESIELPALEAASLPCPGRVYLEARGGGARLLHPLLVHDPEANEIFYLNARRGERRSEYIGYTSGRTLERQSLEGEQRELLAELLRGPVAPEAAAAWALAAQAEEPEDGGAVAPSPMARRIGGFELISRIGQGGMGVVYRAWQPSLGRQVALKCLLRSGDPKAEARFAREIRSLGRVEHPHLVKVFTSGSEGEQWFYAMELVEGADLGSVFERLRGGSASEVSEAEWRRAVSSASEEARRREKPLSSSAAEEQPAVPGGDVCGDAASPGSPRATAAAHIAQVVELLRQVAEAAHALHEAGVIHRDIKPGNILVTADGRHAVLMDLGLAQLADDAEGRLTRTRQFVGTLRYASPEQLLAAASLDRRSDVYSLGATLWELLSLRPLFGAGEETPTPELMLRIQSAEPAPLRRLNPRVPADLEAIVHRCLEKDRTRRYATAADLADDLGRFARGEAVSAQPPTLRYLFGKFARRHRAGLLLAGLLGAVLLSAVAAAFWRIERERAAAVAAQKLTDRTLFDMYTSLGLEASEAGEPARALLWFTNAAELARDDPERQAANQVRIAAWSREVPRPVRAFHLEGRNPRELIFHPAGAYLLVLAWQGPCTVLDLAAESAIEMPALEMAASCAAWSPDGRLLAIGRPGGPVDVLHFPEGESIASDLDPGAAHALAFSPDGRFLAAAGDRVLIWSSTERRLAAELPHPARARRLAMSPAGDRLATGCDDGRARLFALPAAAEAVPLADFPHQSGRIARALSDSVPQLCFLAGGKTLATVSQPAEVTLWDVASGKALFAFALETAITALAASPDGRHLIAHGPIDAQLWDTGAGRLAGILAAPFANVLAAAFTADGLFLVTASSDLKVRVRAVSPSDLSAAPFAVHDARRHASSIPHTYQLAAVACAPDGRLLATAQADGLIRIWQPAARRPGDYRRPLDVSYSEAEMSSDGRYWMPLGRDVNCPMKWTRVYELASGRPAGPPLVLPGILTGGAFSPDGRQALALHSRVSEFLERNSFDYRPDLTPGQARFWDWRSGKETSTPIDVDSEPLAAAYSPGGELAVVLCASGRILCLDPASGKVLRSLEHGARRERLSSGIESSAVLRFSPGGSSFVTAGLGSAARIWAPDGSLRLELRHNGPNCYEAAYSPDGLQLVTSSSGNLVSVWELASGRLLVPPLEHPNRVGSAGFSPDGRRLLTACRDGLARLWDWRRSELACAPLAHSGQVIDARFSADGRWIFTCAWGGGLRVWEGHTGKLAWPAQHVYDRPLRLGFHAGGSHVLVPESRGIRAFSLAGLSGAMEAAGRPNGARGLRLLGELISGQRLHVQGAGAVTLSSREWLERWQAYRELHPQETGLDRSLEAVRDWHRRQAAFVEENLQWDAAAWYLARLEALGERVEASRRGRLDVFVRSWRFAPETELWTDLEAFVPVNADKLRAIEASAAAQPLLRSPGPHVDFLRQFSGGCNVAGYALRSITTARPRRLKLLAGSDDALRIWHDGRTVLERLALRPVVPDEDATVLELHPGENRLLVEVSQAYGYWGLCLRLEDEDGRRLRLNDDGTLEPLATAD